MRAPGRLEAQPKPPGREVTNFDGGATRPAGTGLPAYKRLQIVVDDKAQPVHHPAYIAPGTGGSDVVGSGRRVGARHGGPAIYAPALTSDRDAAHFDGNRGASALH